MPLTTESALRKDKTSAFAPMQHRHFATIAAIIAAMPETDLNRYCAAMAFANELHKTNPNFDRARFLKACDL
jgi:hypothetical protein